MNKIPHDAWYYAVNWWSLVSAIVGAVIGGVFLLVGHKYLARESYKKASNIVFLEMLDNLDNLNGTVDVLKQNNNPLTAHLTLCIRINAYLRYEEDLVVGSISDFQKLRQAIAKLQIAKVTIRWFTPGQSQFGHSPLEKSKETLLDAFENVITAVEILSKKNNKEAVAVGKHRIISIARKNMEYIKACTQAFVLCLPYDEWPPASQPMANKYD